MRHPVIVLLIVLSLLGQSLGAAATSLTVKGFADLKHAALHWQGEAHHHHDDGSFHVDDSKESAQHLAADHLSTSMAVAGLVAHRFSPAGSSAPSAEHGPSVPNPPPDGLLRPPRPHS